MESHWRMCRLGQQQGGQRQGAEDKPHAVICERADVVIPKRWATKAKPQIAAVINNKTSD